MLIHGGPALFPRNTLLLSREANPGGKGLRDAEQLDRDALIRLGASIASEPLDPRETGMSTLGTGKRHGHSRWRSRGCALRRVQLGLHPLVAKQVDAGAPMTPATPVLPEKRFLSGDERMEKYTDLARFVRFAAIPLTLLTQLARAATANAGRIDHTQAPIGAPFAAREP